MRHPWDSQQFSEGAKSAGLDVSTITACLQAARDIKRENSDLPVIFSLPHLAHLTDVSFSFLSDIAARNTDPYRVFRMKKRSHPGEARASRPYRTICVPQTKLMRAQRWIAQNILNFAQPHPASFAFQPGRDLLGAAQRHAGCRWLLKMDVSNFFESISEPRIYRVFRSQGYGELLSFELARICTRVPLRGSAASSIKAQGKLRNLSYPPFASGHLPQGAPSSPMLANLAVKDLDNALETLARRFDWTYTRYADDLAFSTFGNSTRGFTCAIATKITKELKAFGLSPNISKMSISPPGARKIVLGLLVDRDRPRLPVEFRHNIETHLYALRHPKIGPAAHRKSRGFSSTIGMRRHVAGLIAFAHHIDKSYSKELYDQFNSIDWSK